jgi:signal transduction histidine kinase/CheY-like chemotaxis protein
MAVLVSDSGESARDADASTSYVAEADDIRRQILLYGVAGPAVLLGWASALLSLTLLGSATFDARSVLLKSLVATVGLIAILLCRARTDGLARWVAGVGLWLLALWQVWSTASHAQSIWLILTCLSIFLLLGAWPGWAAVVISVGVLLSIYGLAPAASGSPAVIDIAIALVLGMWLIQRVSGALMASLQWMNSGYAAARARAVELSETSAQLALTFKSLQQTSQALARANDQLRQMVHYAEDVRRSKQEFAANVSHELRTPLNLIIGFSDVMLRAPSTYSANLPPGLLSDINVVHRNAQHLLSLINDILDLSQIDVNYMAITREPLQMGEFVNAAMTDFKAVIRQRGLSLTIDVADDLPQVYADRTRVRQVLLNLVANALRFTEHGGITIRVRRDGEVLVISVADTGIGIAPDDLQRIFEPFTQVDSALGRRHGGTGLGLTISRQFVQLHGGRMWVESEVGQGSAFSFTLPVDVPLPEPPTVQARRVRRAEGQPNIVVIDDSATLSRALAHHLEGVAVVQTSTPEALLDKQPNAQPDLIVLNDWRTVRDPGTPLADAQHALDVWRRGWPEHWLSVPLVYCDVPGPEALLKSGQVRRYITKPITQDEFNAALRIMLPASAEQQPTGRILLVEDDKDALHLLSRMLRAAPVDARGHFKTLLPIEALSGAQALEWISADDALGPIDAIFLDLGLGAVSGQEILRALETHPRFSATPVCIVSGQQLFNEPLAATQMRLFKPGSGALGQGGIVLRELAETVGAVLHIFDVTRPSQ